VADRRALINERNALFRAFAYNRPYARQACNDLARLIAYLNPNLDSSPPVDAAVWRRAVLSVSPQDVVDFLIHQDLFNAHNRTQVHMLECSFLGLHGRKDCGCRIGMAATSVDSLIGRLTRGYTIFNLRGPFVRLGDGCPLNSFAVKEYLRFVEFEQALAHITPKQATPMFRPKLRSLFVYLSTLLSKEKNPVRACIIRMDSALIALLFARGKRPGDAVQLDCQMTFWLPERLGILFNVMVGKTLRHGFRDVFALVRADQLDDYIIDPVPLMMEYFRYASLQGADMGVGPCFRNHSWRDATLSTERLTAAYVNARFVRYLHSAGLFQGETLYSLRSGQGLSTIFNGVAFEDMMAKIGWRTKKTAEHYMRLLGTFREIYDVDSLEPDVLVHRFQTLDMHQDLVPFH
jgi:hypothetical protein